MAQNFMLQLVTAVGLALLSAAAEAAPADPQRLQVLFQPSAAALPQAEIRTAIAAELGALLVEDPATADGVISVSRGEAGQLMLTYRPLKATVVRSVPEPTDSTDTPALLALLAGNLVRNEALDLLPAYPELVPPFPPTPAPQPAAASSAPVPPASAPTAIRQSHPGEGEEHRPRRFLLIAGVGSGVGFSRGRPDMNPNYLAGTEARAVRVRGAHRVAGYQISPELAFLWKPKLVVGAQLRLQHVLGASEVHHPSCGPSGICRPLGSAVAVLGRMGWLHPLSDRVRLQISAAAGLGRVRHLVSLEDQPIGQVCGATGNEGCIDTVSSGLLLFGPGVSVFHAVGPRLSAFVSLQGLISVPRAMTNLDAGAGIALRL
jgi:hypothetical protein